MTSMTSSWVASSNSFHLTSGAQALNLGLLKTGTMAATVLAVAALIAVAVLLTTSKLMILAMKSTMARLFRTGGLSMQRARA
jgi:hypothetical protein